MTQELQEKKIKKRLWSLLVVVLLLAVMLVTSVVGWFSISKTPRVNNMALYVNSPVGLEIAGAYNAPDSDWGRNLDFSQLLPADLHLKPVSWSDTQGSFLTVKYDRDGRMLNSFKTLTDSRDANGADGTGYYIHAAYYVRSDRPCKVSLAEAVTVNGGENGLGTYLVGLPEWNGTGHTDLGGGGQYAARVGFQVTKVDPSTGALADSGQMFVYEPNADKHLDGTTQYLTTKSVDGAATLVPQDRLIVQSSSSWEDASPASRDVTIKTLGEFTQNTVLFTLGAEDMARIDMYIWIEGQDHDCFGLPESTALFANIQFAADYSAQSGMTGIG